MLVCHFEGKEVVEECMAVFGLISHLTAGLASGNRKYDITALTFRNEGMSGRLFTLLERNRDREQAGRTQKIAHSQLFQY